MLRITFFLFIMIFSSTALWATGIGLYGTGGVGASTWTYEGEKMSTTDYFGGGGLIIDTAAAKDTLFNYRFTFGYEQYFLRDPETDTTGKPINRFSISNTFGFGLWRAQNVRFWLGPRVGLHYLYKKDSATVLMFFPWPTGIIILPMRVSMDLKAIGLDLMLALGFNFNIGDYTTLFIDVGMGYIGNYNIKISESGHAFGIEGMAGIMFRVDDTYTRPPAKKADELQ
jgi:hypothetical protein